MIEQHDFDELLEIIHFTEEVASKLCGIHNKEEIYRIVYEEFVRSGKYSMSILMITEDGKGLKIIKTSVAACRELIIKGENFSGLTLKETIIDLKKSSIYRRVVHGDETIQITVGDIIKDMFPLPIAAGVIKLFGYENKKSIITPLKIYEKTVGAFAMSSHILAEYLIPSVNNLVKHISNALELSCEYEKQKKLEQLLISNEKKYSALVEDMPVLMCRFKADGKLTFVNEAYCEYFNKKKPELVGQNFFQFIPETDREKVRNHYLSLDKKKPHVTYEHKVIDKDGNTRWQQWTDRVLFFKDDQVEEFQSIGVDITQLKNYEEKIRKMSSAVEQSIDGIAICNINGTLIYVNSSFAGMHGFSQDEILGMPFAELLSTEQKFEYESAVTIMRDNGVWEGEIGHKRKDGSFFPSFMSVTLLKDNNGKPEGILVVMKDIAKIVMTKKELERKNIALKELLSQIEEEKQEVKDRITENVEKIILPLIAKMKEIVKYDVFLINQIELLEKSLKDICSSFIKKVISNYPNLTQREVEVSNMVKNGMTNKDIAQALSISVLTVVKHRQYIRKKLGLTNMSANLFSYLQSLDE